MTALTFRFAKLEEAPQVSALIERAYRGDESRKGWTTEAHLLTGPRASVRDIELLLADKDSRFVLAFAGDDLVSCALIRNEHGLGYFGMFAVDPNRQTQGAGRAMLAAAEQAVRDVWKLTAMTMTVINLREELIAYYERRGYRRTGETKPFPFELATGAVRTDFHLIVLRKDFA
jgi:GNAT superfamily N-acetyltransferase